MRNSGSAGVSTTGTTELTHQYVGPPDPVNPTAPIKISVAIVDDNNLSMSDFTTITNPGIQTFNVRIDTTPDVPRLALAPQLAPPVLLDQQSAAPQSLQSTEVHVARGERTNTSERYLELDVISPDGKVIKKVPLSEEALSDLRKLFANLPDNRYQIYLVRADNGTRRLVMDVFVRRGRVIEPSDQSEGNRDRPPATEGTPKNGAQQNGAQQNRPPQNGVTQNQVLPQFQSRDDFPQLKRLSDEIPSHAAILASPPADQSAEQNAPPERELADDPTVRPIVASRWVAPLTGLVLAANGGSWSRRVGAALEQADERSWQRLRRAGAWAKLVPIAAKSNLRMRMILCKIESDTLAP